MTVTMNNDAEQLTVVSEVGREDRVLFAANVSRGHPYHKLGQQAIDDMTIEQGLELVGVKDEVITKVPLYEKVQTSNADGTPGLYTPEFAEIPVDTYGIKSSVFGIMATSGGKFEPHPRGELLELAYEVVGLDRESNHIDTIGILGDRGQTFFAYIRVPDLVIDPHGVADRIERGLLTAKGYDGKLANVAGFTAIRTECANFLTMALGKGLQQFISVRSTKNQVHRFREAARLLEYSGAVEEAIIRKAEQMLKVDGGKALTAMLDEFYPVDDPEMTQVSRTQRQRKRDGVERLYSGEKNISADLLGNNGWAAYQAFVEYLDWERDISGKGLTGSQKDLKRTQTAVLPGLITDMKVKASEIVLALAA